MWQQSSTLSLLFCLALIKKMTNGNGKRNPIFHKCCFVFGFLKGLNESDNQMFLGMIECCKKFYIARISKSRLTFYFYSIMSLYVTCKYIWCKNTGYKIWLHIYLKRMKVKSCAIVVIWQRKSDKENSIKVRIDAKRNSCHDA